MRYLQSIRVLSILPLVLLAFSLLGERVAICQDLTAEQRGEVEKLVNLQRNMSAGRMNTVGTQLRAEEVSRAKKGDILMVGYQFYATGFTGGGYDLVAIPITLPLQPVAVGSDMLLDKHGLLLDGPDDPRTIMVPNFVPGEPFRLGLVSKDQKQKAFVTVVPNPIHATDHGCSLDVVRLLPKFEIALIEGIGFPADADVELEGNSLGEVHNRKLRTDAAGKLETGILPFVKDKSKGQTTVALTAAGCKPEVSFHWGTTSE